MNSYKTILFTKLLQKFKTGTNTEKEKNTFFKKLWRTGGGDVSTEIHELKWILQIFTILLTKKNDVYDHNSLMWIYAYQLTKLTDFGGAGNSIPQALINKPWLIFPIHHIDMNYVPIIQLSLHSCKSWKLGYENMNCGVKVKKVFTNSVMELIYIKKQDMCKMQEE